LRPHIFTLSQTIDVELMQRGEWEGINRSKEFVEENSNLLAEVHVPKEWQIMLQHLTIGD
jgi:hypothetical protein